MRFAAVNADRRQAAGMSTHAMHPVSGQDAFREAVAPVCPAAEAVAA